MRPHKRSNNKNRAIKLSQENTNKMCNSATDFVSPCEHFPFYLFFKKKNTSHSSKADVYFNSTDWSFCAVLWSELLELLYTGYCTIAACWLMSIWWKPVKCEDGRNMLPRLKVANLPSLKIQSCHYGWMWLRWSVKTCSMSARTKPSKWAFLYSVVYLHVPFELQGEHQVSCLRSGKPTALSE